MLAALEDDFEWLLAPADPQLNFPALQEHL
jgi:hypothetical protein